MIPKQKTLLLVVMVCCIGDLFGQADSVFSSRKLASIRLYNAGTHKTMYLSANEPGKRLSLFIFLSPECPLSQNYLPLFNSLSETYKNEVSFYGIIPGKAYSGKVIREFASQYKTQFSLLVDSAKTLTGYLHATTTPEVILLDEKNVLVYKGAVDDLLTELGKRRVKVTNEYLKNAIVQSLRNETVAVKRTKAVGCRINDY